MEFEINKEIVFSTGHIRQSTDNVLRMECPESDELTEILSWENMDFGHRIYVPIGDGCVYDLALAEKHPELAVLLGIAYAHGCKWLVLDSGGPQYEELPIFDW